MSQAKDAYDTFHVALGTKNAPAFERTPPREQEAWAEVAGVTGWQRDRIENLELEVRHAGDKIYDLNRDIETLEDQLKELKAKQKPEVKA